VMLSGSSYRGTSLIRKHLPKTPPHSISGGSMEASRFDSGFRVPGFGFRISDFGFRSSGSGFRVSGFRFRVSGFGFRVSGFGFRVPDFEFRVSGFEFRISGFGFRDSGSGFQLSGIGVGPGWGGDRFRRGAGPRTPGIPQSSECGTYTTVFGGLVVWVILKPSRTLESP